MSGGVDSSVAAALLVRQGHGVVGAFMKNWSDTPDPVTGGCGWKRELEDAQVVAALLDIPLVVLDFEAEYRQEVIDPMVREYASGRTPNPDVVCNRVVKFGLFRERAARLGITRVATGHYARLRQGGSGRTELRQARDTAKDQTYFLHRLTQEQLSGAVFPVGEMTKGEVRQAAREMDLPVADKKDSVGICFVGEIDLGRFLERRLGRRFGPIISLDGRVVGLHRGAAPFTIGQRHGLRIGGGKPYFVVDKDMARNAVYVTSADRDDRLYTKEVEVDDVHWIAGRSPALPIRCQVRFRHRQPLQAAEVRSGGTGRIVIACDEPQRAVTPGQSAVLYDGPVCLGGGPVSGTLTATSGDGNLDGTSPVSD